MPQRDEMLRRFRKVCDRLPPLQKSGGQPRRLVLGCSAGGDSMALLELMAAEAPARDWRLWAAHLDHAQREESHAEAEFVAERCRALGVPIIEEKLQQDGDAAGARLMEEALREARFSFFRRAVARARAEALVLAHQMDDRAETFLMRALRGSGPTGLASIRPVEAVEGLTLVRPLLDFRRDELRDYLRAREVGWRDDPSNEDTRFDRVWVRREVMPTLNRRLNADVAPRLARAAELIGEEAAALDAACNLLLKELSGRPNAPAVAALRLKSSAWHEAPRELQRRMMRQWLWSLSGRGHPPGYRPVDEALAFVERAEEGVLLRSVRRIHLVKRRGILVAYPPEIEPQEIQEFDEAKPPAAQKSPRGRGKPDRPDGQV